MQKQKRHDSLTLREREVLEWVAHGKTNSEVAIILGISRHTVKKHVEHLLHKLGANNRVALAIRFISSSSIRNTP